MMTYFIDSNTAADFLPALAGTRQGWKWKKYVSLQDPILVCLQRSRHADGRKKNDNF